MSTSTLPMSNCWINALTWGHGECLVSLKWFAISLYTLWTFSNSQSDGSLIAFCVDFALDVFFSNESHNEWNSQLHSLLHSLESQVNCLEWIERKGIWLDWVCCLASYHRKVYEMRVWRCVVIRKPSLLRTISIFLGVIPCFQPYLDSPDITSNDRRGNNTDTFDVYSLLFVAVGFRKSITTSLANDSEMMASEKALCVSACRGIPVNKTTSRGKMLL